MAYKSNMDVVQKIAQRIHAMAEQARDEGVPLEDFCGGVTIAIDQILNDNRGQRTARQIDALRIAIGIHLAGQHGGDLGVFRGNDKRLH